MNGCSIIVAVILIGTSALGQSPVATPPQAAVPVAGKPAEPSGDEDPVEILVQLRDHVVAHGERIPNHTCVETIQRDVYEPAAGRAPKSCDALLGAIKQRPAGQRLRLDSSDRLRLDVAYASGREIYSWAGASRFEEGELDELVPEGAMGTGPFATMLLSIFTANRGPKYIFEGETAAAGRRLFQYSFAVVRLQSHYQVKAQKEWIVAGYTGTLLVDPKTAELVRLTVRTEELPPATDTCETDTTLEYGLVKLAGEDYILPRLARQRFIGREGTEAENTMEFSACRDFQAESKVAFGESSPAKQEQAGTPPAALDLPRGLPVTVELLTPVRFSDAAAGDLIQGRLASAIRDERGHPLIAEGTAVQGRLMRVETRYQPAEHTVVLRWETIDAAGARVPLTLLPNRKGPKLTPAGMVGSALRLRVTGFELPRTGETRYGIVQLPGDRKTLDSGSRSEWFTAKP